MKLTNFIEKLKHIESLPTTYYSVAGGDWAKWNGKSWNFDCVILVKAILWGWSENKKHAHGGAIYNSNNVFDDSADGIINRCKNISTNFKSIPKGSLLWMSGHVGVYIGNGEVIECTGAWEGKVVKSQIGSKGERTRNGVKVGSWKKHGLLPYIEYEEEKKTETSTLKYKVGDVVTINGVYMSSTSDTKLTPAITKGTITKILKSKRNPYLLDNGNIGWVNDSCIIPCEEVSKEIYHTVVKYDTLWNLAQKYYGSGLKYPEIKKLNNLKSDTIYIGQKLRIK